MESQFIPETNAPTIPYPFSSSYVYLLDFLYANYNHNAYLPLHHIKEKGVVLYKTLKCAQTSLAETLDKYLVYPDGFKLSHKPQTFVGFVRDPYERAKSIIDMSIHSIQCFYGVTVNYKDFLSWTTATDEHFLPQICFIPVRRSLNIGKYITGPINKLEPRRYDISWHNVTDIDMLDILEQSPDSYKFIRMRPGRNAVIDLYRYLQLDLKSLNVDGTQLNVGEKKYRNTDPARLVDLEDPEFRQFVEQVYSQDIKFYNKVKCVND
jgi:hypothetical protein